MSTRIINDGNYVVNNTTNNVVLDIEAVQGVAGNSTGSWEVKGTATGTWVLKGSSDGEMEALGSSSGTFTKGA